MYKLAVILAIFCAAECMTMSADDRIEAGIKKILKIEEQHERELKMFEMDIIKMSQEGKLTNDEIGAKWTALEKMKKQLDRETEMAIDRVVAENEPRKSKKMMLGSVRKFEDKSSSEELESILNMIGRELEKGVDMVGNEVSIEADKIGKEVMRGMNMVEKEFNKESNKVMRSMDSVEKEFNKESNKVGNVLKKTLDMLEKELDRETDKFASELENEGEEIVKLAGNALIELVTGMEGVVSDKDMELIYGMVKNMKKSEVEEMLSFVKMMLEKEAAKAVGDVFDKVTDIIDDIFTERKPDVISNVIRRHRMMSHERV